MVSKTPPSVGGVLVQMHLGVLFGVNGTIKHKTWGEPPAYKKLLLSIGWLLIDTMVPSREAWPSTSSGQVTREACPSASVGT